MLDYLADPKILAALLFVFVVIATIALVAPYLPMRKNKKLEETVTATSEWQPTGKIDFHCTETPKDEKVQAAFLLRVEDFRTVESISGVEHVEIRWRNATLAEAKSVVVAHQNATESGDRGYTFPRRVEPARVESARVEPVRAEPAIAVVSAKPDGSSMIPAVDTPTRFNVQAPKPEGVTPAPT